MKQKSSIWGLRVAMFAFSLLLGQSALAQDSGRSWALKAGVGGIFTGHISGEVEVFLKGRVSIAVRGALIHPNIDSLRGPAEGFYLKAGPKFYLSEVRAADLAGFAIKPELLMGHLRDWETNVRGNYGNRWVNTYGLTCNVSYNLLLWNRVLIEPSFGIGYVAQFESLLMYDDHPPYTAWKSPYDHVYANERSGYEHSQMSLAGDFCVTGGVLLGVRF